MPRSNVALVALAQLESITGLHLRQRNVEADSATCWEYLWVGHANATGAVGQGVLKDLSNFADSAAAYTGPGHFAFYVDSDHGTDAGYVSRQLAATSDSEGSTGSLMSAADHGASDNSLAHSLNSKLITTQHFDSIEQTGLAAPLTAAAKNLSPTDSSCTRIVSYAGHGYNFNGIGYQDHKFMPWRDFTDPMHDAFGGPVDLLALDTCRMATYMMLQEVQGTAMYVMAHEHNGVQLPGYGSWAFEGLPLRTATDAKSFATQLLTQSMAKGKGAESKGISLFDMDAFAGFSQCVEQWVHFVTSPNALDELMPYLLQARKASFELTGPSLYEPDNAGMLVDAESFLRSFQNALPSPGSANVDSARSLTDAAIKAKQQAIVLTDHDDTQELAGTTGLSFWFMKPEAGGLHTELLKHIRQRLTRAGGGRWTDFLGAYYSKAATMQLGDGDMHEPRQQTGPVP